MQTQTISLVTNENVQTVKAAISKRRAAVQPDLSHLPCGTYIRVSTVDQGEKYGPESQRRAISDKIRKLGWALDPKHTWLDMETGKTTDRPAFQSMMEAVKQRRIRGVVVYSIDRLNRSIEDALMTRKQFARYGVELEFSNMEFENTPVGNFMFNTMASIAQFEVEQLRDRTAKGRAVKLSEGAINGGVPPYGYSYKGKAEGSKGEFVINKSEAAVVKQIFGMALRQGLSLFEIAHRLNEAGVPTRKGKRWRRNTIRQMIYNRAYCGEYGSNRDGVSEGYQKIPAIVSVETVDAVAAKMQRNRTAKSGQPSNRYLLRGLLYCAKCRDRRGNPRRWTTACGGPRMQYGCGSLDQTQRGKKTACGCRNINVQKLDSMVWKAVWETVSSQPVLMRLAQAYHDRMLEDSNDDSGVKLDKVIARMQGIVERLEKILRDPDSDYDRTQTELREARLALSQKLSERKLKGTVQPMPKRQVIESMTREFEGREARFDTWEKKRGVLDRFIEQIVTDGQEVEISGRITLPEANVYAGSSGKNCTHRENGEDNSLASFPFTIKRKVA